MKNATIVALALAAACAGATAETKQAPAAQGAAPIPPATQSARESAGAAAAEAPAKAPAPGEKKPGAVAPAADTAANAKASGSGEEPMMPDAAFRASKPAALPVQPNFEAPVPVSRKLKNGARVLVVENHALPLVSVSLTFQHGIDAEPVAKAGLADFVAAAAQEGTDSRPATKFAEELEDLAAHLSVGAGSETMTVHLNCLAETLPQALGLLADLVQHPAFRPDDVERVRVLRLARLQQKLASPGMLAGDVASRILFGPKHPWGQPAGGTPQTVASITPDDLRAFHDNWWVPNDAVISVAGDVRANEIVRLLDEKLAGWKAKATPKLSLPALPHVAQRRIEALDKQGTTQSQVWVVGPLFPARHPDAIPLRVANMTLGGLFGSRLNMNLREKHGYSYGVFSGLSLSRASGVFRAQGGIVAKNTVEAIGEYERELERFLEGVTDEELAAAKEAFIRGLPSQLETNDAVASAMGSLVTLGLPLDYYAKLPDRVRKVTRADVARVAKQHLKPAQWPVIVVGPVEGSREKLEQLGFGPVEVKPSSEAAGGTPAAKPDASAAHR